jgi:hypothetical protein
MIQQVTVAALAVGTVVLGVHTARQAAKKGTKGAVRYFNGPYGIFQAFLYSQQSVTLHFDLSGRRTPPPLALPSSRPLPRLTPRRRRPW